MRKFLIAPSLTGKECSGTREPSVSSRDRLNMPIARVPDVKGNCLMSFLVSGWFVIGTFSGGVCVSKGRYVASQSWRMSLKYFMA